MRDIDFKQFYLFLLLIASCQSILANKHNPKIDFERASLDIHLPQSSVYSIIQDRKGFLWFATREGIARWDGYNMRILRHKPFHPQSLIANVYNDLLEDCDGNIWAWAVNDPHRRSHIDKLLAPDNNLVKHYAFSDGMMLKDNNCNLWAVDAKGIHRYLPESDAFEQILKYPHDTYMTAAIQTAPDSFWLGTENGEILFCSLSQKKCSRVNVNENWIKGLKILTFYAIDENQILVSLLHQGLAIINTKNRRVNKLESLPEDLKNTDIRQVIQSKDQSIWMIGSKGVIKTDENLKFFNHYPVLFKNNKINTESDNILIDDTGAIWVGSVWGVFVADPNRKVFNHIGHNPIDNNSLSAGLIMAIHADESNNLWVGSFGGGLNKISLTSGQVKHYPGTTDRAGYGILNNIVWSIQTDSQGNIWSAGQMLHKLDIETDKIQSYYSSNNVASQIITDYISNIYIDEEDTIWLATAYGLYSFDPELEKFSDNYLPNIGFIQNISRATHGDMWIATNKTGLLKYSPTDGIIKHYKFDSNKIGSLSNNTVSFAYRDRLGTLWVGTNAGLNRLNDEDDTFTLFSSDNGLPGDVILSMLEKPVDKIAQQNNFTELWVSTNRGLASIRSAKEGKCYTHPEIRIFDYNYGIKNIEFNRHSATQHGDDLYFGGDHGITYFSPKDIIDNPKPPVMAITNAYQIDEKVNVKQAMDINKPLVISADISVFGFEFAALSFSYPQHNQYQYQLLGFEDNWSQASKHRQAQYLNVPPGEYIFRVRGSNADGQWNKEGVSVSITVQPWFWETLWFRLLMLVLFVVIVILAVVYVMQNQYSKRLQKVKYKQALLDERDRISRDMHDEIGASLSEIVIFSQQNAINHKESVSFNRIAQRAREVLEAIGEIIWATNPRNDKFETLVAYMREQAATMLDSAGIHAEINFPNIIPQIQIAAEARRNLYLIMKEALINAIKHAQASVIIVSLEISQDKLTLLVQDNGNGQLQQCSGGLGLKNLQKRADSLDALLKIQSVLDMGSSIKLEYRFNLTDT